MSFWCRVLTAWGCLGLLAGCAQTRLIAFHDLDRARKVELHERSDGKPVSAKEAVKDAPRVILDEPGRIERVAAIVSARKEEWQPAKDPPRALRYVIVFKHVDGSTESFGFDEGLLATNIAAASPADVRYRKLTPEETKTILETFRFTTNSPAR